MRHKILLLLFLGVFLGCVAAAKKKKDEKLATDAEINYYLFNDTKATYLKDYKEKGPTTALRSSIAAEENYDVTKDVFFGFISKDYPDRQTFTYDARADLLTNWTRVINAAKPLRVIIHGWKNDGNSPMIMNITEAYMHSSQDVTLMIVDWSRLANENYLLAREFIFDVANVTAEMLQFMYNNRLAKLDDTYVIGHSLGGHTAGFVGKNIKKLNSKSLGQQRVPLIIALDPAGPLFTQENADRRLDKNDADYVIVLHTSSLLGYTEPLGHADFYANYGFSQPGCEPDWMRHCAHSRAYQYLADAIENKEDEPFWAVKCNANVDDMESEECNPSDEETRFRDSLHKPLDGLFLFKTNEKAPWARPKVHLGELRLSASSAAMVQCGWKIIAVTFLMLFKFY